MSKSKPNIITPFNDRDRFKALVQEVINDTTIFTHVPDSISLSGNLFTLTLSFLLLKNLFLLYLVGLVLYFQ